MKAEDLMVGDWVCVRSNDKEDTHNFKITSIIDEGIYGHNFVGFDEDLEPIPLTQEILEKNGYSYNENREAWEQIPNDGFGICKDIDDNCFYFCVGIFDAFNRYSDITYHDITKVEYVHELQHALKLCRIEKGIIL